MTITTIVALWAILVVTLPVALTLTAGSDLLLARNRRWAHTRCVLFFLLYLTCEVLGTTGAFCTWLFAGTWAGRSESAKARLLGWDAALQRVWSSALFLGAVRIFSMRLEIERAELAARGPYLLFVRHASTADTALAAAVIANPYKVLLRYVLKRELLWDPCLDIVGQRLPNAFVERSGSPESGDIEAVRSLAANLSPSDGILIFPEGTRFSRAKLERARERLRTGEQEWYRRSLGFRHILPPRIGGALALLDAAPGIDAVFFAQSGFEKATSFAQFWNGAFVGEAVRGRVWRISADQIPESREARIRWLFDQWLAVDDWVDEHIARAQADARRVPASVPRTA